MKRIFAPTLAASLLLSPLVPSNLAHAESNSDPNPQVNRMNAASPMEPMMGEGPTAGPHAAPPLPQFSGNVPSSVNLDRTHGINAPGTLIGPSPENGQPDPRFPNSAASGGNEINAKSTSQGSAQAPASASGAAQVGGMASTFYEGLPSASHTNNGYNSTQPGARLDRPMALNQANPNAKQDGGSGVKGAAPWAIGAGAVMIGAFFLGIARTRALRRKV